MRIRTLFAASMLALGVAVWTGFPFGAPRDPSGMLPVSDQTAENCAVGNVKITATSLHVRDLPVNGPVIGYLAKDTLAVSSRCATLWANISVTGWVHGAYLAPAETTGFALNPAPPAQAETTAAQCRTGLNEVTAKRLNLRATPKNGAIIGRLVGMTDVKVDVCKGVWARATATGWASARYLSSIPLGDAAAEPGKRDNPEPDAAPRTPSN